MDFIQDYHLTREAEVAQRNVFAFQCTEEELIDRADDKVGQGIFLPSGKPYVDARFNGRSARTVATCNIPNPSYI